MLCMGPGPLTTIHTDPAEPRKRSAPVQACNRLRNEDEQTPHPIFHPRSRLHKQSVAKYLPTFLLEGIWYMEPGSGTSCFCLWAAIGNITFDQNRRWPRRMLGASKRRRILFRFSAVAR